jgi:hypothetical protein
MLLVVAVTDVTQVEVLVGVEQVVVVVVAPAEAAAALYRPPF